MSQKITLYEDRIAVRPDPPEGKSAGGIDLIREKARGRGTVVLVGRGKRAVDGTLTPLDVVPGDVVMYGRFTGGEIDVIVKGVNETLMLMRECDVIAVVGGDEPHVSDIIPPPPIPVDGRRHCRCGNRPNCGHRTTVDRTDGTDGTGKGSGGIFEDFREIDCVLDKDKASGKGPPDIPPLGGADGDKGENDGGEGRDGGEK